MQTKTLKIILIVFILKLILVQTAYAQTLPLSPEYIGFIQQKLDSFLIYPTEAQTRGWEGIVKIRFTLAEDGRIKEIDVAESSGYPLLDAAAILAIKDASPYPFPEDYFGKELEITLPVTYEQPKPLPTPSYSETATPSRQEALAKPEETKENPPMTSFQDSIVLAQPQEIEEVRDFIAPANTNKEKPVLTPMGAPQELTNFINLASENNQPTKVAREEIELAQVKIMEAQRNLFPALKISNYYTKGEIQRVGTEETETKLEFDQPIFYGGRLTDTVNQAKANLEITQKNYDRLKLDVMQKTETSYYNLVAAKMHLKLKEELRQQAKDLLGKIERLSAAGMIIPLELNSATTSFEQIEFQMDSIKHDLYMAELTFKQVLNVKEVPPVEAQLLEAKKLDLVMDRCLEAAYQNRPEVYLSELLVKFNDYGQKIKESEKDAFVVDFTSSYGLYSGHYQTEPWREANHWYVGFKVAKPWGGSTFNTSYSQGSSEATLGQTTPTTSSTVSTEFNVLDSLKRVSDKKRSDIDLHRSLSDFDETLKTITFEVQDAFLNYQKSVLQLNAAQAEMKFRRNEAEVIKIRSMVGETSLSNAMESLYSLSDAQSKYIQALANYQISIANLKKATGYGIKI